jgi:hypothetical protein
LVYDEFILSFSNGFLKKSPLAIMAMPPCNALGFYLKPYRQVEVRCVAFSTLYTQRPLHDFGKSFTKSS